MADIRRHSVGHVYRLVVWWWWLWQHWLMIRNSCLTTDMEHRSAGSRWGVHVSTYICDGLECLIQEQSQVLPSRGLRRRQSRLIQWRCLWCGSLQFRQFPFSGTSIHIAMVTQSIFYPVLINRSPRFLMHNHQQRWMPTEALSILSAVCTYDYFLNRLKGNDKTHDHGESIGAATSQAPPEVCVVSPLNVCVYFL